MWPFIRITALLMVAPVVGSNNIDTSWRLTLALFLAIIVAYQAPLPPAMDLLSIQAFLLAAEQVLIGISIGFVLQMVFSALSQAGEIISVGMGLHFARAVDPMSGQQVPVVAQFFVIIGSLLFLSLNGHLILIELLIMSFETLPVGGDGLTTDDFWEMIQFSGQMFSTALLIAIPALATMLMINIAALGIAAKAAPQLHIFAVGFPIMKLVGFILIVMIMPAFADRFGEFLLLGFDLMGRLVRF